MYIHLSIVSMPANDAENLLHNIPEIRKINHFSVVVTLGWTMTYSQVGLAAFAQKPRKLAYPEPILEG